MSTQTVTGSGLLELSKLTDAVINQVMDKETMAKYLQPFNDASPAKLFDERLRKNQEAASTMETFARGTIESMAGIATMIRSGRPASDMKMREQVTEVSKDIMKIALATAMFYGYQLAKAQLDAELANPTA